MGKTVEEAGTVHNTRSNVSQKAKSWKCKHVEKVAQEGVCSDIGVFSKREIKVLCKKQLNCL